MSEWRDPATGLTDKERWPDPVECDACGTPMHIVSMEVRTFGDHVCFGTGVAQPSLCSSVSSEQKQSTEVPSSPETEASSQSRDSVPP